MHRQLSQCFQVIFTGCLLLGASISSGRSFDEWADKCSQSTAVVDRVGEVTPLGIQVGMASLNDAGLLHIVGSLSQREACLSVLASHQMKKPVIVAFAKVDPDIQKDVNPVAIARLRDFYEREFLAKRLSAMNVSLNGNLVEDERARIYSNRAILTGGEAHQRSFAAVGRGACVISLRPERLADYLQLNQPYVWKMIGESTQQAIVLKGSAWEFWHEVGHCSPERAAKLLAGVGPEEEQLESWADRKRQGMQSCSPADAAQLWEENAGRMFRNAKTLEDLNGEPDPTEMNRFIQFDLIKESLADRFAQREVESRLNENTKSCTDRNRIQHPWYTLRLAWSIRDPDARYMTWITPWLSGLPEASQHQTMVDAHEGLMVLAGEALPKAIGMEVHNSRQRRPDLHRITDPNGTPEPKRVNAWKAWVSMNLNEARQRLYMGNQ